MIKLLGILLPFALLFAQEKSFLLPDQQNLFVHFLAQELKSASHRIVVLTPRFNHADLKKALLHGARKGSAVTLIVQDLKGDPLSLVQYERIDLLFYNARKLEGSTVIIDEHLACTLPLAIEQERFSNHASLVRCSDEHDAIISLHSALQPLIKRSIPYLK